MNVSVDASDTEDIINEQRQVLNLLLFSKSINFQSLILGALDDTQRRDDDDAPKRLTDVTRLGSI